MTQFTPYYSKPIPQNIQVETTRVEVINGEQPGIHLSPMDCVWMIFLFWAVIAIILIRTSNQEDN